MQNRKGLTRARGRSVSRGYWGLRVKKDLRRELGTVRKASVMKGITFDMLLAPAVCDRLQLKIVPGCGSQPETLLVKAPLS